MDQGWAIIVAALVPSSLVIVDHHFAARDRRKQLKLSEDTHRQVVTLNESTIGELAANQETRRAREIAYEERTAREQRHLDTAPPNEPPQGPSSGEVG